jgi:Ca2+-binding RTX toxin-like protein
MPADGSWPPELDVMEVLGQDPTTLYTTVHTLQTGTHSSAGSGVSVASMSSGYHTYGVDWEADKITWYYDGKEVFETATPADMNKPMYLIANLAVGGYWPGAASASTPFPANMQIDYIKAWSSNPYAGAAAPDYNTVAATVDTGQVLSGGGGDDLILGGAGNDQVLASSGNDTVNGKTGHDTIAGGAGTDWLYGGQGDDLIRSGSGSNVLLGNMGADTLDATASLGSDTVRGGQGDDVIVGGSTYDWLSGDRGNDTVTGGHGADIFHAFVGSDLDRVTDFNFAEGDRVQLDPGSQWNATQVGADTIISLGSGDEMILANVQLSTLGNGWIFAA